MLFHRVLAVSSLALLPLAAVRAADWPQWGGSDGRNMVSAEKNLPDTFTPIKSNAEIVPGTNVKWVVPTGGAAYGNPTIAGGRVFVGTDDKTLSEDSRFNASGGGLLKCLDEQTGKLLWQLVVPKRVGLPKEWHYGFQHLGTCSSPLVDGDRVYLVTSAMEVLCLDVHGQADGNAGPFTDEAAYMAGRGKPLTLGPRDADIVWRYDLIKDLGAIPHDTASCSVVMLGDLIYLSTSNGVNSPHTQMMAPDKPALIALDKKTGKLAAFENERISSRVFHCQWSPQSLGKVNGKDLLFFGGGDGFCYAFEALASASAEPVALKKVWSIDCNPPEYRISDGKPINYLKGDKRKKDSPNKHDGSYVGPSEIIGTPVFHDGKVYVAIGQDPMHGRGRGMMQCIDAATGQKVWSYDGLDRTTGQPTIADGLVYIPDVAGRLHCVEQKDGKPVWVFEGGAESWGGTLIADGKVYYGTQRELLVLKAGREMKLLSQVRAGSAVYTTPVTANGVLYVASQRFLWAVERR